MPASTRRSGGRSRTHQRSRIHLRARASRSRTRHRSADTGSHHPPTAGVTRENCAGCTRAGCPARQRDRRRANPGVLPRARRPGRNSRDPSTRGRRSPPRQRADHRSRPEGRTTALQTGTSIRCDCHLRARPRGDSRPDCGSRCFAASYWMSMMIYAYPPKTPRPKPGSVAVLATLAAGILVFAHCIRSCLHFHSLWEIGAELCDNGVG